MRFFKHLIKLLANESTTDGVKGNIYKFLTPYKIAVVQHSPFRKNTHEWSIHQLIERYYAHPETYKYEAAPPIPAGSPIGCGED